MPSTTRERTELGLALLKNDLAYQLLDEIHGDCKLEKDNASAYASNFFQTTSNFDHALQSWISYSTRPLAIINLDHGTGDAFR